MGENWPGRLHRQADRLDATIRPALRRAPPLERAWIGVLDAIVSWQPDRTYLRRSILPALAKTRPPRVLFVGVRGYTRSYARAFAGSGAEFWTTDIDPAAARHGAGARHVTADVRFLDGAFPPGFFQAVILNGVFGWGVDQPDDMARTVAAVRQVLAPEGVLLLGWNHDRCVDPATLPSIRFFEPIEFAGLPHRKTFRDVTHVYAWYRR